MPDLLHLSCMMEMREGKEKLFDEVETWSMPWQYGTYRLFVSETFLFDGLDSCDCLWHGFQASGVRRVQC